MSTTHERPQEPPRRDWHPPTLTKERVEAHAWGPIECGPPSNPIYYSSEDNPWGTCC